ncbi:ABC transporter transmembrane domain-containing protein [Streptomyces oceani]|uniref:ABC transporter permease n=1 Tax=Streptomyces oceani TaxID=1075402 RepID=A0A1E7JY71_9ACTN|nr:ABC transporter ATP-binding protein [Streptomyces oceani]OEU96653.1 ABC transporter permease [Streptomyces oceani]
MLIRELPYADPGVPDARSGRHFLLWLGRMQWAGQAKSLAWGLLHMGGIAAVPLVMGMAIQAVVTGSGARLAVAGGLLALVGVASTVGDTMLHRTAVSNWITAAARVQQLLARRTAELGATLTQRVAAGEVVAVSTGDIEKIGWCVESVSRFSAGLLVALGVGIGLVIYEPQLGLLVAAGLLVLLLTILPLLPRATRRADVQREEAGRATELAADTVAGLRVLRGIGGEELFLERYRRASQRVRRAAVRTARMWAAIEAVQVALPGLLLLGVVWHGTRLALDGRIAVGELVTVYGAVTFLLVPLRMFQEFAMAYSFSRPSAARAARVLALRRTEEAHPTRPSGGPPDGDALRTRDDAWSEDQDQEDIVEPNADLFDPETGLCVTAGGLTAVVCGDPDVAGRLAARLGGHVPEPASEAESEPGGDPYDAEAGSEDGSAGDSKDGSAGAAVRDADEGKAPHPVLRQPSVRLGDTPLDELPLDTARGTVLVQDKDPVLLSGTLRELLDVPRSGRVSAREALEAARCGDVLEALVRSSPESGGDPMAASITERGRSLSGGQRQRLALARSLVTDPRVLVLDDPTSAVDAHTEARIAESLRRIRTGRTTVVFCSSPLMLDRADEVRLISEGKAVASGSHQELLRDNQAYRRIVTRETHDGSTEEAEAAAEAEGTVTA